MSLPPVLRRLPTTFRAERAADPAPPRSEAAEADSAGKALFCRPGTELPSARGHSMTRWPLELAQYFCAMVAAHHLGQERCLRAAADVLSRRISRRQASEREHELRQYRVRRARRFEPRG